MRPLLITGLILLAALLPLVAIPLVMIAVVATLLFVACVVAFERIDVQPVALLALAHFRAPPAR